MRIVLSLPFGLRDVEVYGFPALILGLAQNALNPKP